MEATVWRVEDREGIGMFFSDKWLNVFETTNISNRHLKFNTPKEDGLNLSKEGKDWYCGYKSEEDLRDYVMPQEFVTLIDLGFKVYKIKVFEFQEGKHQFIFTQQGIIEKIDITNQFI